jgi:hypothetical protein
MLHIRHWQAAKKKTAAMKMSAFELREKLALVG